MKLFNIVRSDLELNVTSLDQSESAYFQDVEFIRAVEHLAQNDTRDISIFIYMSAEYPETHPFFEFTVNAPAFKEFCSVETPKFVICMAACVYRNDAQIYAKTRTQIVPEQKERFLENNYRLLGSGDDVLSKIELAIDKHLLGFDFNKNAQYFKTYLSETFSCPIIILVQCKDTLQKIYPHAFDVIDFPNVKFVSYKTGLCRAAQINTAPLANRTTDVVVTGTASAHIYPYRHIFRMYKQDLIRNAGFTVKDTYLEYAKAIRACRGAPTGLSHDTISSLVEVRRAQYASYQQQLQQSKISICCSSVFMYPLAKYFESISQGAVVVGDDFLGSKEHGFVHNENIVFCDVNEIDRVCIDLLSKPDELDRIQANALNLARSKLNLDSEVRELVDLAFDTRKEMNLERIPYEDTLYRYT